MTTIRQITDPEVQALASIAAILRSDYVKEGQDDPWAGSPFAWIRTRPSRQVGKILDTRPNMQEKQGQTPFGYPFLRPTRHPGYPHVGAL